MLRFTSVYNCFASMLHINDVPEVFKTYDHGYIEYGNWKIASMLLPIIPTRHLQQLNKLGGEYNGIR